MPVPSFRGFVPSSDTASRTKQRVRSTNTEPELDLRRTLWAKRLRFQLNVSTLPGKPDIVFKRQKVAIFVDGDFWHGRDWKTLRKKLRNRANGDYWIQKIKYNRSRDRIVSRKLATQGWHVIRVWEKDVKSNAVKVAEHIANYLAKF
jgi:DNA mismatch endonuclease, patch repair protein